MLFHTLTGDTFQFTYHNNKHKMNGMHSLSTSTKGNKFCHKMHNNCNYICSSCYAFTLESMRGKVRRRYELNTKALSSRRLKDREIPIVDYKFCRFNAFGELVNLTHYFNLVAIAEANTNTTFALWTKRISLLKGKVHQLTNMFHVASSWKKNIEMELPENFNKVFTVFNKPYARENDIDINCTASCRTCLLCYTHNDVIFVRELVR